ncbi:MAG: hypothetical protein Q4G40_09935 [Brachybacterium sp.]|nr:hypothetical protein [Brachybacterium sp.]
MAEPKRWADGELVTAEDMNRLEARVSAVGDAGALTAEELAALKGRTTTVEGTVDRIKLANISAGEGPPSGDAPVGWTYLDLATGDHYRMEA